MKIPVRYLIPFLLLAAIATPSLQGQEPAEAKEKPEYEGPLYYKPDGPRPAFDARINRYQTDGLSGQDMRVTTPMFEIVMATPSKWSRTRVPGTSLAFVYRADPQVFFSLAIYEKKEFISEITEKTLVGYVEGLRKIYEGRLKFLNEGENEYKPKGRIATPLNQQPYVVKYETWDKEDKNHRVYHEYFFFMEDTLFSALYSTPADGGKKGIDDFEYLVDTMYVYVPEDDDTDAP